jgi:hypothetical protein
MLAWQIEQWKYPEPLRGRRRFSSPPFCRSPWRLAAPYLSYREPVVKAVATLEFALMIMAAQTTWVEAPRHIFSPIRWASNSSTCV